MFLLGRCLVNYNASWTWLGGGLLSKKETGAGARGAEGHFFSCSCDIYLSITRTGKKMSLPALTSYDYSTAIRTIKHSFALKPYLRKLKQSMTIHFQICFYLNQLWETEDKNTNFQLTAYFLKVSSWLLIKEHMYFIWQDLRMKHCVDQSYFNVQEWFNLQTWIFYLCSEGDKTVLPWTTRHSLHCSILGWNHDKIPSTCNGTRI